MLYFSQKDKKKASDAATAEKIILPHSYSKYQNHYDMLAKCGAANREERKWSEDSDIGG